MARFDGTLICTDFDSTLAWEGKVSPENCDAIRYYQQNGGKFTIVSGRYPKSLIDYCGKDVMPNTYICGMNGVFITDHITYAPVYESVMDNSAYEFGKRLVEKFPQINCFGLHTNAGELYLKAANGILIDAPEKIDAGIYKCLFIVDDKDSDFVNDGILNETEGRYSTSRSWINGIEYQKLGEDKGKALKFLKKELNIETAFGIGDYENDIPLIKAADIGCAVSNAIPQVKAAAKKILPHCRENAVAELIYSI